MPEKNEKPQSPWKVEELWRKGFVKKMSFDPGVEVRRSNGW